MTEEMRNVKKKKNNRKYEKGECVGLSNHVQFLKNTDYLIYNTSTGL